MLNLMRSIPSSASVFYFCRNHAPDRLRNRSPFAMFCTHFQKYLYSVLVLELTALVQHPLGEITLAELKAPTIN